MKSEELIEVLKKVAPITAIAESLRISRPTLYKQITAYCNDDLNKVSPAAAKIFNLVANGDGDSINAAKMILEDYKNRHERSQIEYNRHREIRDDLRSRIKEIEIRIESIDDKTEQESLYAERRQLSAQLDEEIHRYRTIREELDVDGLRDANLTPDAKNRREERRAEWRASKESDTVHWSSDEVGTFAIVDTDFNECIVVFRDRARSETTVEYLIAMGEELSVIGRYTPETGINYVRFEMLPIDVPALYRVKQNVDGETLDSGPCRIRKRKSQ